MRRPEDTDFCYYPFFQILVTAEGKYRPCSKHDDHITHEGRILTTRDASLEEAWSSDYMERMRDDFRAGRKFPGCAECWRLQRMGLRSMRYDSWQYEVPETQVENPVSPLRVELNSSNVCNLRCRICSPTASSKWIMEGKRVYGWNEEVHINLQDQNLQNVLDWSENLQELCLFGGEPLISKENIALLDALVETGRAASIDLLLNTNGTVFDDHIAHLLGSFRSVRLFFSIDDLGERFEYQRKGANWDEVVANLRAAYDLAATDAWRNVTLKICCTVSSLNIYYFPEFFAYFDRHFPGLKIFWNLLYNPWEFSVQILPADVKARIRHRLENDLHIPYEMDEGDTKTLGTLLTYLDYDEPRPFDAFFRMINRHDLYRGERFATVFPALWSLVEPHRPDDLTMGTPDVFEVRRTEMLDGPEGFPHFEALEGLRRNGHLILEQADVDLGEIDVHFVGALREISAHVGQHPDFDRLLAPIEDLLAGDRFSKRDLYRDLFVFGPFIFYKELAAMTPDNVQAMLRRKYPVRMDDKYLLPTD